MTDVDPRIKKIDELIATGKQIYNTKPTGPHKQYEVPSITFYNWGASVLQYLKDNFDSEFILHWCF
jgi:hypothetical protein